MGRSKREVSRVDMNRLGKGKVRSSRLRIIRLNRNRFRPGMTRLGGCRLVRRRSIMCEQRKRSMKRRRRTSFRLWVNGLLNTRLGYGNRLGWGEFD